MKAFLDCPSAAITLQLSRLLLLHRNIAMSAIIVLSTLLAGDPAHSEPPAHCTSSPCYVYFGRSAPWVTNQPTVQAACAAHAGNYISYKDNSPGDSDCILPGNPSFMPPSNWAIGASRIYVTEKDSTAKKPAGCDAECGNPISPLTGSKREPVDTNIQVGLTNLVLTYDNASKAPGSITSAYSHSKSFGELWFSNLHRKITLNLAGTSAVASRGSGKIVSFVGNGSGAFTPDADSHVKLVTVPGGLLLTDNDDASHELYNSAGQLTSLVAASGKKLTFFYDGPYLTSVFDGDGRSIQFEYSLGRIIKIRDAMGRTIVPAYDSTGNLISLTWQDGKIRQFLYENPSYPWALTGVSDENNSRYSTFGYDSEGRAISTEHAGGVNRFSVAYTQAPSISVVEVKNFASQTMTRERTWNLPVGPVVTGPNGASSSWGVADRFGMPVLTGKSQVAGSGSVASASTRSYDINGNISSETDFGGSRRCSSYDLNRNLPVVVVTGLSSTAICGSVIAPGATMPAESRKTTTQWHPDWSFPVKVASPLQIVSNIYNGQPDPFNGNLIASCAATGALTPEGKPLPVLCGRVDEGTTDASGGQGFSASLDLGTTRRVSSFTYDVAGRMLTESSRIGSVTTYTYHSTNTFSAGGDLSFHTVGLLLHGDGPNNSTTFADSSLASKVVSMQGSVRTRTDDSKFGGSSIYFNGEGSYLTVEPKDSLVFQAADYTVEFWVKFDAVGAFRRLISSSAAGFGTGTFNVRLTPANRFYVHTGGASGITSSLAVAAGTWYHVAVARQSGTTRLFVDGSFQGSEYFAGSTTESIRWIGGLYGATNNEYHSGFMDEIRITKGLARYVAAFTPPVQAFENVVFDAGASGQMVGDLQSVTNASGHVTQYTQYDRAGRVRQMIDPKGVVTDTTYTPRGWVASSTVTPPGGPVRTTTFNYDNAGQLTGVVMPDATTLTYSYDAAHRLTGVTDTKGNTVTYTLDNTGNRLGEQVKDPQGNLQRSITRVYDALNRVQQTTGAAN